MTAINGHYNNLILHGMQDNTFQQSDIHYPYKLYITTIVCIEDPSHDDNSHTSSDGVVSLIWDEYLEKVP